MSGTGEVLGLQLDEEAERVAYHQWRKEQLAAAKAHGGDHCPMCKRRWSARDRNDPDTECWTCGRFTRDRAPYGYWKRTVWPKTPLRRRVNAVQNMRGVPF